MNRIMQKSKRFCLLALALSIIITTERGYSQEAEIAKYPRRPITYIIPTTPGASADLVHRLICKNAEKFLGQPIVVKNEAGGKGIIGVLEFAKAKPDGYMLGYVTGSLLFVHPFFEKVPYDPVKDFTYIMQFGVMNMGIYVRADSPFKTIQDLINYGRQNPKKLTFGAPARTGFPYQVTQMIASQENVQLTHIPFKQGPEVQTAVLGGHVSFGAGDFSFPLLEAGQIRVLLLLKEEPSAEYPQIPVLKDIGRGNTPAPLILQVSGPKGMPEPLVKKIEDAFTKAMKEPDFIKGMKELRLPIVYRNSRDLTDYVTRNSEIFAKFIREQEKEGPK